MPSELDKIYSNFDRTISKLEKKHPLSSDGSFASNITTATAAAGGTAKAKKAAAAAALLTGDTKERMEEMAVLKDWKTLHSLG